ncbi:hypothetical protein AKO1_001017 [Acrasis kona]|uniref:Zn(2)-C6 fungal-type domain-containing protein n=1 Tax=Acrasis kona TaxID=1008807 RepID=A0AAW2ZBE2_9EUKA
MNTTTPNITCLARQSCSSCRKMHKKCDRLLPVCGLCSKRGKTCSYDDENVRNTQPRQTISKSKVPQTFVLDESVSDINDFIFQSLNYNMPFIPPEKLEKMVKMVSVGIIDTSQYTTDELAFVHSAFAIGTKYKGNLEASKVHFDKARTLMALNLDLIVESYITAGCCCFLGTYCALQLETSRAEFYCTLLRLFIDHQSKQSTRDKRLNFIEHEHITITSLLSQEPDMELLLKKFMDRYFSLSDFYRGQLPDLKVQEEVSAWLTKSDIDGIYSDLRNRSNKEFPLNPERFEKLTKFILGMYKGKNTELPAISERWGISMLILHGAQLQYYQNVGDHQGARREADLITEVIVERNVIFKMAGVIIKAAANVHLQDYEAGVRDDVLVQKLKDDYTAVKSIAASSNLWKVRLDDLKQKLEEAIWNHTNHLNILCNRQYSNSIADEFIGRDFVPVVDDNIFGDPCMTEGEFEDFLNTILD